MQSRARLLGHAIHPMLIVLPLGLFIAALVFDFIYMGTSNAAFAVAAWWNIAAGVVGGLLAALFGLVDWLAIPKRTRARRLGAIHGIGNVIVVACYGISFLLRGSRAAHSPEGGPIILEVAGILLGLVTAWLGGELVQRFGVSVTPGAHVDAPSSLSQPHTALPEESYAERRDEERRRGEERREHERRRA